ncbi:ABC transporter permease [Metasolibacillus sp. FSL H7-0170]|uniref:ABC transporter permease n=1 Tax=Metasolibacillus TaxID=2703677 RepID=UPI0007963E06|nr:ABC transporter permease [Metasolibacillus fluoroglycofenilyticus]KYG91955.1 sodium ABC transporter permease [[Bacillus] sp. KCTC 13219]
MSKFFILLKENYKQKLKAKSFIITTVLYILGISLIFFWSDIKEALFSSQPDEIIYVNTTSFEVGKMLEDGDIVWTQFASTPDAEQALKNEGYDAAVVFSAANATLEVELLSLNPLPLTMQQKLSTTAHTIGQFYAMDQLNLTAEQSAQLLNAAPQISMKTLNEAATDGKSEEQKSAGMFVSYVAGFLVYIFVISFLSIVTSDVASEKGSRALEMLLVSVKAETHFKAKVTSIFLVALSQFALLFGTLFILLKTTDGGAKWTMVSEILAELHGQYLLYVAAFLLVTIFLFLIIGALLGSLVSKPEEASQAMMPAMILVIVAFFIMVTATSNPDTLLVKIGSYVPFTSGMVMPMRIGATDLGVLEPLLSLAILVASTFAMYLVSISFYKRSVLTYSTGGLIQKIKTVFKVTT